MIIHRPHTLKVTADPNTLSIVQEQVPKLDSNEVIDINLLWQRLNKQTSNVLFQSALSGGAAKLKD